MATREAALAADLIMACKPFPGRLSRLIHGFPQPHDGGKLPTCGLLHSSELFFKTLTMFLFAADLDFQMLDVARDASTWVRTLEYAIMIQNTLFPYVTTYHIIGMLEEFLLREWFYYRLMEYGLLLDLRDRERMKHFFKQSGMFWYVFVSVRARVETG